MFSGGMRFNILGLLLFGVGGYFFDVNVGMFEEFCWILV
jgi:hypothetical protein